MTVENIYEQAMSLYLEKAEDNEDYTEHVVNLFNLLLAELFRHNNVARERNGLAPLTKIPRVESTEEENPYEWQFEAALVYGLIAKISIADENTEYSGTYQQQYYALVNDALMAQEEKVEDVYAADSD